MSKYVIRSVPSGIKFDLKASNGQIIATSEVYTTQAACRKGIASIQKNAPGAHLENQTEPDCRVLPHPKFELFQDRSGKYRFRLKANNGQVIAVSEGYATKSGCLHGIESVKKNAQTAQIQSE